MSEKNKKIVALAGGIVAVIIIIVIFVAITSENKEEKVENTTQITTYAETTQAETEAETTTVVDKDLDTVKKLNEIANKMNNETFSEMMLSETIATYDNYLSQCAEIIDNSGKDMDTISNSEEKDLFIEALNGMDSRLVEKINDTINNPDIRSSIDNLNNTKNDINVLFNIIVKIHKINSDSSITEELLNNFINTIDNVISSLNTTESINTEQTTKIAETTTKRTETQVTNIEETTTIRNIGEYVESDDDCEVEENTLSPDERAKTENPNYWKNGILKFVYNDDGTANLQETIIGTDINKNDPEFQKFVKSIDSEEFQTLRRQHNAYSIGTRPIAHSNLTAYNDIRDFTVSINDYNFETGKIKTIKYFYVNDNWELVEYNQEIFEKDGGDGTLIY